MTQVIDLGFNRFEVNFVLTDDINRKMPLTMDIFGHKSTSILGNYIITTNHKGIKSTELIYFLPRDATWFDILEKLDIFSSNNEVRRFQMQNKQKFGGEVPLGFSGIKLGKLTNTRKLYVWREI